MSNNQLENIPANEREHYLKCDFCQQYFDMRDLQQVFEHEHNNLQVPPKITGIKIK